MTCANLVPDDRPQQLLQGGLNHMRVYPWGPEAFFVRPWGPKAFFVPARGQRKVARAKLD
jgi:hypothetical protein